MLFSKEVEKKDIAVLIIILTAYLFVATKNIHNPGLSFDEMNFAPIALGAGNDGLFSYKIFGIPVYTMPYIGALKSYIYSLIFSIFGVSIVSIRLPLIILGAISLIIIFFSVKKITKNFLISSLIIVMMAFDVTYIIQHRFDLGPTVLEMFLKSLSVLLFIQYIKTGKQKLMGYLFLILSLGLYNKLNFIWFINSLYISSTIIFSEIIFTKGKKFWQDKKGVLISGSYLFFVSYFIFCCKYFRVTDSSSAVFSVDNRLEWISRSLYELIGGVIFSNFWFNKIAFPWTWGFVVGICGVVILAGIILLYRIKKGYETNCIIKFYGFFSLQLILIIIQIFITADANKPWHMYSIYPYFWLLLGMSFKIIYDAFDKKIFITICYIVILGSTVIYDINIYNQIHFGANPHNKSGWANTVTTTVIYDLINYAKEKPDYKFISVDWGITTQLRTFIGEDRTSEQYGLFLGKYNQGIQHVFSDKKNLFITHGDNYICMEEGQKYFYSYIQSNNLELELVKEFEEEGETVFQIWAVK